MPAITLRNVRKDYGGKGPNAVAGLDLTIEDGEFVCLLGPSGCGKTTTLRMIAGLENLSDGELQIGDRVVDSISRAVFVPPEKRELGLVFQSYALWPHMTIEENTAFGLKLRKVPKAERQRRVDEVMKALAIDRYRDRYPAQLSGGQQQRVALARMLVANPGVLLLDEPLSNLDARLRLEMRAELKRIHAAYRTTIVFVTHDQWEAMTLADTIAVMNEGRLQQLGAPDDIYDRPANRFVAEFVGSPPINIVELQDQDPMASALRRYLSEAHPGIVAPGSVGIRPESIGLAAAPGDFATTGQVRGILPTGGSWIVDVDCGGRQIFLTTGSAPRLSVGDQVSLGVPAPALHVFDAKGDRIADADACLRRTAA